MYKYIIAKLFILLEVSLDNFGVIIAFELKYYISRVTTLCASNHINISIFFFPVFIDLTTTRRTLTKVNYIIYGTEKPKHYFFVEKTYKSGSLIQNRTDGQFH